MEVNFDLTEDKDEENMYVTKHNVCINQQFWKVKYLKSKKKEINIKLPVAVLQKHLKCATWRINTVLTQEAALSFHSKLVKTY